MGKAGRFLADEETPDHDAFIDKIINLKITRREVDPKTNIPIIGGRSSSFVIRSDYEINYDKDGKYYFTKCVVKPSIRVKYDQVAENTTIGVKVDITNLHIFTEGDHAQFGVKNFPIKSIEIHMGYIKQFPDFRPNTYTQENYFNMDNEIKTTVLNCSVFAVYPTKVPPDSITTFNCLVGSITTGFEYVADEDVAVTYAPSGTMLPDLFTKLITKRFIRNDYFLTAPDLKLEDGVLSSFSAGKYGVNVFLSNYIRNGHPKLPERYSPEGSDSSGNDRKLFVRTASNITRAFENIRDAGFPTIRLLALYDGNYIAYDVDEDPNSILESEDVIKYSVKDLELPAVYSMTFGATRTIKCPFFYLLKPFQQVHFQSRYNISSAIGYFYQPEKGQDTFTSIKLTVDFATVEDINEMTLVNVDSPKEGGA